MTTPPSAGGRAHGRRDAPGARDGEL